MQVQCLCIVSVSVALCLIIFKTCDIAFLSLTVCIVFPVVNSTPSLNDLYQHITAHYANNWKLIGNLLGLPIEDLIDIEAGYSADNEWCCNQMLEKWLKVDATASWGKLLTVIKSPAVASASDKGDYLCVQCCFSIALIGFSTW